MRKKEKIPATRPTYTYVSFEVVEAFFFRVTTDFFNIREWESLSIDKDTTGPGNSTSR